MSSPDFVYTKEYLVQFIQKFGFEIGEYTYGRPVIIWPGHGAILKIGKFCSFANNVQIYLSGNHRIDWITTYPFSDPIVSRFWPGAVGISGHPATRGDVVIGNDVWLANDCVILSGVSIGDGAVIGARSVVTTDVPPYTIVAGNPARNIRKRFTDENIEKLLAIQWWNWPKERLEAHMHLLCSGNVDELSKAAARE